MSTTSKKKLILNTVSVDLGCGRFKKPKLPNVFHPKPKHNKTPTFQNNSNNNNNNNNNHLSYYYCSSSSTSSKANRSPNGYDTATTFSPAAADTPPAAAGFHYYSWEYAKTLGGGAVRGFGRVGEESVAVEKESNDPYLDFRQSMLQMILEKEIYSKEDLKELLNCFLQLNSPYHHGIIVRAFTEIWNGVFFSAAAPSGFASHKPRFYANGCRSRDF